MISSVGAVAPCSAHLPRVPGPIKDHRAGRVRLGAFEIDLRSGELYPAGIVDDSRKTLLREQPLQVRRMFIEGGEEARRAQGVALPGQTLQNPGLTARFEASVAPQRSSPAVGSSGSTNRFELKLSQ
jgi:hypothetical protein